MDTLIALLIPALLAVILMRLLLLPLKWILKAGIHSLCGFLCLWLLNWISGFTGVYFPINIVTAAIAGFLGLPGIGLLALVQAIL